MEAAGVSNPLTRSGPGHGRRKATNKVMEVVATVATVIAVAVLAIVIVSVFIKGVGAINIDFLTHVPAPFGQTGGGIADAIVGSLILVAISSVIAIPIGILIAIYTNEFAPPRISSIVRFALDILNGVPTIVTGIFVFGIIVVGHIDIFGIIKLGGAQSGWAGGIGLAIVMLPIVARSAQEVLLLVPRALHEAALALGLRRWRIVTRIVVPTAIGGMITGAVLGVARVAGETAPLLFTSSIFSELGITTNPSQALPNIPVKIFELSESPAPSDHQAAWAAALLLILFVLALNIVARTFHERSRRRIRA
jgi:phosphate transport system permease protein